jgi:hypothetical protein
MSKGIEIQEDQMTTTHTERAEDLVQEYLDMYFPEAMETYGRRDGYRNLLTDLAQCNTGEFSLTAARTIVIADIIIKAVNEALAADTAAEKAMRF